MYNIYISYQHIVNLKNTPFTSLLVLYGRTFFDFFPSCCCAKCAWLCVIFSLFLLFLLFLFVSFCFFSLFVCVGVCVCLFNLFVYMCILEWSPFWKMMFIADRLQQMMLMW